MQPTKLTVFLLVLLPLSVLAWVYLNLLKHKNRWLARFNVMAATVCAMIGGATGWQVGQHAIDAGPIWPPVLGTLLAYLSFVISLAVVELLLRLSQRRSSKESV
jgi:divalent metal cation (Fe/Co/Zn/Cd) transporter